MDLALFSYLRYPRISSPLPSRQSTLRWTASACLNTRLHLPTPPPHPAPTPPPVATMDLALFSYSRYPRISSPRQSTLRWTASACLNTRLNLPTPPTPRRYYGPCPIFVFTLSAYLFTTPIDTSLDSFRPSFRVGRPWIPWTLWSCWTLLTPTST